MAAKVVGAVKLIHEGLPLLRDITRKGKELHQMTATLVATEGEVDEIHSQGLRANF